jgi:hypothetical protein
MRLHAALGCTLALVAVGAPRAQTAGVAEITSPSPGEALAGVVTILGTASHPDFLGYDLAFAYAENPTDTWFALGDPVNTPVTAGRLGLWDTTGITDGDYTLRLRLWLQDGTALTVRVEGLRVRNHTPIETSTPAPTPTPGATVLPTASPPSALVATPTPPPPQPSRAQSALLAGAAVSVLSLTALGTYSYARSTLRPRWAALRSRRLHRRMERRDRNWRTRR